MNCLEGLKELDDGSVDCCVTSPPYWALRDYGHPDQIGQEDTPGEYVVTLLKVFMEVHRVLASDGTLWLNIGDTYCGAGDKASYFDPKYPLGRTGQKKPRSYQPEKIKAKDMVGIPWRLAFALRESGYYLRNDITWAKPNPMPESIRDRFTKSHEHIFLFAKSPKYYFDQEATLEYASYDGRHDIRYKGSAKYSAPMTEGGQVQAYNKKGGDRWRFDESGKAVRNKRDVWFIPTSPLKDAHYAAFPTALIEPCILAGCPPGGIVLDPFIGSGSTAVASLMHGRRYIGFELNAEYVAIAERRLSKTNISIIEYIHIIGAGIP
jgi:DNA modification methylase